MIAHVSYAWCQCVCFFLQSEEAGPSTNYHLNSSEVHLSLSAIDTVITRIYLMHNPLYTI